MAVADVPAAGPSPLGDRLDIGVLRAGLFPLGVPVADLLTATLLLDHKLLIIGEDQRQVGLGGFLHVANIRDAAGFGKRCGQCAEWFGGIAKGAGVL